MVQPVTSTMEQLRLLMLQSLVSSDVLWLGLISSELLKFVQTQILLQMLRKLVSLVQKVSVSAVQSICSSRKTESLLSVR